MISRNDVQNKLALYLRGDASLESLREWLVEAQLDESNLDASVLPLLCEAEGRYAELSDGLISQASFKKYVLEILVSSAWNSGPSATVAVYSNPSRVLSLENNTANAPQNAQLRPSVPEHPILPVMVELVGSH